MTFRKQRAIPIILKPKVSAQKAFLVGLFSGKSLKQLTTANPNSPWAYIQEGLLSERYLRFEMWGGGGGGGWLVFGTAFLWGLNQ